MPHPMLEFIPLEVLEHITLKLVESSFLGPPSDVLALLLTSRRILNKLSPRHNHHLYARIFVLKFDTHAPSLRLGTQLCYLELSTELVKRCLALKRIKSRSYDRACNTEVLRKDLWTAYLMFLEDSSKNWRQLVEFANVDQFALDFISLGGPLHDGADKNNGWILDTEENALALWLFWFTDKQRVLSETPAERQKIFLALNELFVASCKYACNYASLRYFHIPSSILPTTIVPTSFFAATASVNSRCLIPSHFGSQLIISRPLLIPPALLSCVVRYEANIATTEYHPPDYIPATREIADEMGWTGPTRDDYRLEMAPTTRFVEWGNAIRAGVTRHDEDWGRLRASNNISDWRVHKFNVYTPGSLHGKWVGKYFGIPLDRYADIVHSQNADSIMTDPPHVYRVSMQFILREHFQTDPRRVLPFDDVTNGEANGVRRAWLPRDTRWAQIRDELEIRVPGVDLPYLYQTYSSPLAGRSVSDDDVLANGDIRDIVLTAETDERYANAWGFKKYHGRIRLWDGLIVLVRERTESEGSWVFRGYLHGMQNLVGLWQAGGLTPNSPTVEGVWSMTKVE